MTCPKCGGDTWVRDSKSDAESVHRQRVCKDCEHVFFTIETDAGSHLMFYEASSRYYRARYDEKKRKKR